MGLNLRDVQPDVCLRHLNALVSRHPHFVEPITPVRDFDLARYSFVESVDVVASLGNVRTLNGVRGSAAFLDNLGNARFANTVRGWRDVPWSVVRSDYLLPNLGWAFGTTALATASHWAYDTYC